MRFSRLVLKNLKIRFDVLCFYSVENDRRSIAQRYGISQTGRMCAILNYFGVHILIRVEPVWLVFCVCVCVYFFLQIQRLSVCREKTKQRKPINARWGRGGAVARGATQIRARRRREAKSREGITKDYVNYGPNRNISPSQLNCKNERHVVGAKSRRLSFEIRQLLSTQRDKTESEWQMQRTKCNALVEKCGQIEKEVEC